MSKILKVSLLAGFVFIAIHIFFPPSRCAKGEAQTLEISEVSPFYRRLKSKADSAKTYAFEKGFNTYFCFLVDFAEHSGKERFFVWDFNTDTVKYSSLCAHGYGGNSTASTPVFSNTPGSYCSSLGHYRIGERAYSRWGINIHYKMHGLDPTNNKAYERIVVLHSFDYIPKVAIYPAHLPLGMSQGCPVISNETMREIDTLMRSAASPVLMWIYN